jgi:predicted metal-dependent enzyme (double-stranded beta helix superfamily)
LQILDTAAPTPFAHASTNPTLAPPPPLPMRLLAAIAAAYSFSASFEVVAGPRPGERTSARVHRSPTHDIWLIRWAAGSRTVLHDHGGSAGALYVVAGGLVEHHPNPTGVGRPLRRELRERDHRPMPASHVHEVANESNVTATSIHVYSPPLEAMHHYELTDESELRMMRREVIEVATFATE